MPANTSPIISGSVRGPIVSFAFEGSARDATSMMLSIICATAGEARLSFSTTTCAAIPLMKKR